MEDSAYKIISYYIIKIKSNNIFLVIANVLYLKEIAFLS